MMPTPEFLQFMAGCAIVLALVGASVGVIIAGGWISENRAVRLRLWRLSRVVTLRLLHWFVNEV